MALKPNDIIWNYFINNVEPGWSECKICHHRFRNNRSFSLRLHITKAHNEKTDCWKYFNHDIEAGVAECKICKQRLKNNRSINLKLHMRKLHNEKNEIWKYFDNFVLEGIAKCKTCKRRLKNRTCNLRFHMKRSHNIEVKAPDDDDVDLPASPPPTHDQEQTNAELQAIKRTMNKKYLSIKMEKKIIIRSIIGLMIEDGITPHLFGSKHIEAMLQPMCEAISDQEGREFKLNDIDMEHILSLLANHIRNDFSDNLHWRLLSLKIDTDLNASPKSFCVSALFVNEDQIQTCVLGVIDLKNDNRLSEKYIKEVLHKFNIDSNQIVSVCWDNTKGNYCQQVKNSDYLNEIKKFESYPDIYLGDSKIERYIGDIAQLCLLDIFKNSQILEQFLECRNLTAFINDESNGYYDLFENKKLKIPQLDSPWKWGSTYIMMHDLKEARFVLENIKFEIFDYGENHFNLNDNLWSFIDGFCQSLNILQKSILKFYSEEMHFGDFYAQWLKCKLLVKLAGANTKNKHVALITSESLSSIEKRSKELLSQDRFEACLYLDPRFQHTLNLQQKTNALEYLRKLWSRAKLYNLDVEGPSVVSTEELQEFNDDNEDACLNEFLSQDVEVKDKKSDDIYNKIEGLKLPFQAVVTNILSFWKDQKLIEPEMYVLSAVCFAMPATQNYSKECYAHIHHIEDNSQLSSFTKDNLLNLRLNVHFLDNAIEQLEIFKDKNSYLSLSSDTDTLSEENDSNTASTSTASTSGIILSSKTATVTTMSSMIITSPLLTTTTSSATESAVLASSTVTSFLPHTLSIKKLNSTSSLD